MNQKTPMIMGNPQAMTESDFVESCRSKYKHEELPEGQFWEDAHYPTPKCKQGVETTKMWSCDHTLQGLLQSEVWDYPCIHGFREEHDRKNLEQFYPEFIPLYEKWLKRLRQLAGSASVKKAKEEKTGIFGFTQEELVEAGKKGGLAVLNRKIGIFSQTTEQLSANGKKGSNITSKRYARPVVCIETGVVYPSIAEAVRQTGVKNISNCCHGRKKTAGGCTWKLQEEV